MNGFLHCLELEIDKLDYIYFELSPRNDWGRTFVDLM